MPANSSFSIKNLDDPSIIGGSEASNSIIQLSIPKPTKAAKTCSEVFIVTPCFSRLVPLWVVTT